MLDWLLVNKEWVFSGVGVIIATTIISSLWGFTRRNPPQILPISSNVDMGDVERGIHDTSISGRDLHLQSDKAAGERGVVADQITNSIVIPGDNNQVFTQQLNPTPTDVTPPFTTASEGETLIVIAAFHSTVNNTEPHVKIHRMIRQQASELGIAGLRVEVEPTVLTADERSEANSDRKIS